MANKKATKKSDLIRVRVKKDKTGFIYGVNRTEGQIFNLKPVKHSVDKDEDDKPVIIPAEKQFSKIWMEKVSKDTKSIDQRQVSDMDIDELKEALTKASIDFIDDADKSDLVVLLEEYILSQE